MAIFCIPKQFIDTLQKSALKSNVNLEELYGMDSKTRREYFTKFTDKQTGQFINTKFEQAMVSKQQEAMLDWAKSVFTPSEKKKPQYKTVLDKIQNLQELGVLNERAENAFLEDLVTDKLGISIKPEEMQGIMERATKVEDAQKALGPDMGDPDYEKENIAYFKALKEINDYMQSISPSNPLAVATGTIGRGLMLASLKSPLLNIGSNLEIGLTEAIARRFANATLRGADNKAAADYIKLANKIYQETGFDISRMSDVSDLGSSGARVLGDTVNTQGPGIINKAGRIVEDIVFKNLMGAPDAAFASFHLADSVNLQAMALAEGDKTKAKAMMKDALRVKPQTKEGEILRAQGISDAMYATWTNESWASKFSLGVRKLLNDATGDARLGDYVMPFVKTPANVIATGMDYAGGGAFTGLYKLIKAQRSGQLKDTTVLQDIVRPLMRAGLGLTAAALLAMNTDDDDYVGAYDPQRAQIEQLRGSVENSFRIGDTWISTDWLGPLAVPYNGIMHAKKYGKQGAGEFGFQYGKGVAGTIAELPGITELADAVSYGAQRKDATLDEMFADASNKFVSDVSARLVPSIIGDIAKVFDDKERKTTNAGEALMAKIPGVRNTLPEKKNIFGDAIEDENPLVNIFFGSRVSTDTEDDLIKELDKVQKEGEKSLNFTDWNRSSSKKIAQFRENVGEERFQDAVEDYGHTLRKEIEETMRSSKYKELDPVEKLNLISGLDTKAQDKVFERYHFEYVSPHKK